MARRMTQTARRKVIYKAIHGETEHGGNQGPSGQFVHTDAPSFAEATAEAIGKDARTARRDAERGEKVCEAALSLVRGTALDTNKPTA